MLVLVVILLSCLAHGNMNKNELEVKLYLSVKAFLGTSPIRVFILELVSIPKERLVKYGYYRIKCL